MRVPDPPKSVLKLGVYDCFVFASPGWKLDELAFNISLASLSRRRSDRTPFCNCVTGVVGGVQEPQFMAETGWPIIPRKLIQIDTVSDL